jgi:myo-inositol-1(or 4)-monophosphatase
MQALLNTAIKAARRAGDTAVGYLNRAEKLEIRTKARNEFVTQVDHEAEAIIIESIRERYPEHAFLAEESGRQGQGDFVWIIDPLDGTTNFVHGFPVFAVSLALQVRDELEIGVIYDPNRQELFTAMRGQGAQLDGRRIRVSQRAGLDGALCWKQC